MPNKLNPATVEVEGRVYEASETTRGSCRLCVAEHDDSLCAKITSPVGCVPSDRRDGKSVIWVERKGDPEAWRADYRERQAKGEKFQYLVCGAWLDGHYEFSDSKDRFRPKPVEPVVEAPAEPAARADTDWFAEYQRVREKLTAQTAELARLQAVNRIAVRHLDRVLNERNSHKVSPAEDEARDWLESIGDAS